MKARRALHGKTGAQHPRSQGPHGKTRRIILEIMVTGSGGERPRSGKHGVQEAIPKKKSEMAIRLAEGDSFCRERKRIRCSCHSNQSSKGEKSLFVTTMKVVPNKQIPGKGERLALLRRWRKNVLGSPCRPFRSGRSGEDSHCSRQALAPSTAGTLRPDRTESKHKKAFTERNQTK